MPLPSTLYPIPYTLYPLPYTLYPLPYPLPHTLYPFLNPSVSRWLTRGAALACRTTAPPPTRPRATFLGVTECEDLGQLGQDEPAWG
jgi:hypothetical protein